MSAEHVPSRYRRRVTNTQYLALKYLKTHGACVITHGTRTLQMGGALISMKADAEHFLLTSGMVEKAGGNYPPGFYKISEYGEKCYMRDFRDARVSIDWAEISR